jgi:hypothetical protein
MNWNKYGRSGRCLILPIGTEESHEKPEAGQSVCGLKFVQGTFRIGRVANHLIALYFFP